MDKRGLINKTVQLLSEQDARKPVPAKRSAIHISDDDGHSHNFIISKPQTALLFTKRDVGLVVDALMDVIIESIQDGESISVYGFGTLGIQKRAARTTKHPVTKEPIVVNERYTAKFVPSGDLRRAAKLYGVQMREQEEAMRNAD